MTDEKEEVLPCGHNKAFEVEWRQTTPGGIVQHVWFCIACNYAIVCKKLEEGKKTEYRPGDVLRGYREDVVEGM